jgi:putative alpha-1,2-mannosidase
MGNENWCMIGYHSVSVLANAIDKGLDIDKKKVLEAMINSSNVNYYDGTAEYKQLGYVPFDKNGNGSSIILEYAYDDWTIYNTALKTGVLLSWHKNT